jgi:YbbR domain-containing protein
VTGRATSLGLFRHLGLKALALGLAVLLWMVVAGEEVVERGLRVPLELQQFPPGLELLTEPPSVVDVRVRGSSGALARLTPSDIVAALDLRSARAGRRVFQLTSEEMRVPFGVEVVQITPATITLTFEKSATRQVAVLPSHEGDPAPGFVVGRMTVNPSQVEVIGPESVVNEVAEALTAPVSIAGARATVVDEVSVGFENPALRLKTPRLAKVSVEIVPGPGERPLRNVPVHLTNLSEKLTAEARPSTVNMVLRGTREALSGMSAADVSAYVDLAGLGPGEYTLNVRVDASDNTGAARIDPSVVQVRIGTAKN